MKAHPHRKQQDERCKRQPVFDDKMSKFCPHGCAKANEFMRALL
jgi:hypothetical protein